MALLIIDRRPPYLDTEAGTTSVLMLPIGAQSYLDYIISSIGLDDEIIVVPAFEHPEGYQKNLRAMGHASLKVVKHTEINDDLANLDPETMVSVVDAGCCPARGMKAACDLIKDRNYRGATHVIAVGNGTERAREKIIRDVQGNVRHVQRLFPGTSWPHVANKRAVLTIAPAGALSQISFTALTDLRARLGDQGVLQRDLPLDSSLVDLTTQDSALELAESLMPAALRCARNRSYSRKARHVLMGRDCWVDKSVRVVGPVILHGDVMVEENASIIGPTIIGAGGRVGRNAVVAQSILDRGAVVEAGTTVCHSVSSGGQSMSASLSPSSNGESLSSLDFDPYDSLTGMEDANVQKLPGYQKTFQMGIKRMLDIVLSVCVLVVLAPLLAIVASIVKVSSPGPLFFVHQRESKGGKEFGCIKFRTMSADAHARQKELYAQSELDGPQFKMDNDPRVTRVGAFLRSTNIDELPQFINVLLGHMSIIGPRPSPFRENQVCVPWRRARLSVNPGITGLWQVCRSVDRSEGDFHEWIYYDTIYVKRFSLWLDAKILLATVLTLGGRWSMPLSWIVHVNPHRTNRGQTPSTA